MELYLIRHGQSLNNIYHDDPSKWVPDPALSEHGHRQATLLAEYLTNEVNLEEVVLLPADAPERAVVRAHRATHLYVSPMLRTLQTARPIAQALGLKPEIWIDIHEHGGITENIDGVEYGRPGLTRLQVIEQFPDYTLTDGITDQGWYFNPGYEDFPSSHGRASRVSIALRQRALKPESANEALVLVSHGTFLDHLLKALFQRLPGDTFFHWHYNTAITRLDLRPNGEIIMRYFNRTAHLPHGLIT